MATIQDKATLKLEDYIVKSWGEDYPQLALNEHYCMRVAKYAGIKVPEFYISGDDKLFIMNRFDIRDDGSYERIVKTIKTFVSPVNKKSALKQFYKMIVVSNLVKNGDAHLKNFGLIYDDITNINLALAYDIVSTVVYIKIDIPALHLLGSKNCCSKKWKKFI